MKESAQKVLERLQILGPKARQKMFVSAKGTFAERHIRHSSVATDPDKYFVGQ